MRILIAPNAFKGSLTAHEVAQSIFKAFTEASVDFDCKMLPVGDGGDGTAKVLADGLGAQKIEIAVQNPLGRTIKAPLYLTDDGTAIIELADASGIRLLTSREHAPLQTHTFGLGQLMQAALERSCKKMIIGVGGSATLDCGMGMLRALGVRFLNHSGSPVIGGGGALERIVSVDVSGLDPRWKDVEIEVACDVDNYLLGKQGAAHVFGRQKGANPFQVELLERNHRKFSQLVNQELGEDMSSYPHGGAAGGVSAALKAVFKAELRPGAILVLDTLEFSKYLDWADFVITGEGRIDEQSKYGKAPFVVAQQAQKAGKVVIGVAGSFVAQKEGPFDALFSIQNEPGSLEDALLHAEHNLFLQVREIARLCKCLKKV